MKIITLFIAVSISFVSCSRINTYFGWENDHPIEEAFERSLEEYLELPNNSVDFTPELAPKKSLHFKPHHFVA